jgi:hypothetical protein
MGTENQQVTEKMQFSKNFLLKKFVGLEKVRTFAMSTRNKGF